MVYHSLWDKVVEADPSFSHSKRQEYSGSLDDVLNESKRILLSPKRSANDNVDLALHAPRMIRAVLNYKIDNPNQQLDSIVRETICVALKTYDNQSSSVLGIERLRSRIGAIDPSLLSATLKQPSDMVTWDATNPEKSANTAQKLLSQSRSKEVLFIALGHGGVAAGMDVYLRHCDQTRSQNSVFYTVRFSTQKSGDKVPRLTANEIEYLKECAKGRQVVVFDEDKASGCSLREAEKYFNSIGLGNPLCLVNLDMKTEMKLKYDKDFYKTLETMPEKEQHNIIKEIYLKKNNPIPAFDKKLNYTSLFDNEKIYEYMIPKEFPSKIDLKKYSLEAL